MTTQRKRERERKREKERERERGRELELSIAQHGVAYHTISHSLKERRTVKTCMQNQD